MDKSILRINPLLFLIIFFAFLSYGRTMVWVDEYAIWNDALINSSGKVRPHLNMGNALVMAGLFKEAIKEYKFVKEKEPHHFTAYIGLGSAYLLMKNRSQNCLRFIVAHPHPVWKICRQSNACLALLNRE